MPASSTRSPPTPFAKAVSSLLGWLEALGLGALALGQCLELYLRILLGRGRLDLPALASALHQAGLSMLPAITLVAIAVGSILGRLGADLLSQLNLPGLILFPFSYAVIMELTPVLIGILVAGRAGVALAVRQATLLNSGELDGLLVCGVNPIHYTTAPALLAMLIMSFGFVVWAALVTFVTTYLWLFLLADVPPAMFAETLRRTLSPGDLIQAAAKSLVFAAVIALVATVSGIGAGRRPGSVTRAATRAMIGAVTAILLLDLAFLLWPDL